LIKVLVVDDHELVRSGISRILADQNGIEVIGEAASGEDAVQFAKETPPDIVLMDIRMPGIGGLEATRKILRQNPDVHVIAVTLAMTIRSPPGCYRPVPVVISPKVPTQRKCTMPFLR